MILGIVGNAGDKFDEDSKEIACLCIRQLIDEHNPRLIISGACHLGGIDKWAVNIAGEMEIPFHEYNPEDLSWPSFKKRNLLIAKGSDKVVCIVVKDYPKDYKGERFKKCYHCKYRIPSHVKSGGCWTA
jgi:hypothetical protein